MRPPNWGERFLATTRGKIILLLRRQSRTVHEMSEALGLTDNNIRAHLATLERDGYVEQEGMQAGTRRPHHVYRLTPHAERLFVQACDPAFMGVLSALEGRLPGESVEEMLREAGRQMARAHTARAASSPHDDPSGLAAEALGELGAVVDTEQANGDSLIRALRCPLADAVREHPAICLMMEAFLGVLSGQPVLSLCERSAPVPNCQFLMKPPQQSPG